MKILSLGDRTIIKFFRELDAYEPEKVTPRHISITCYGNISFDGLENSLLSKLENQNDRVITQINYNFGNTGFYIQYHRGGSSTPKQALYDEIVISINDNNPDSAPREFRLGVVQKLSHELMATPFEIQTSDGKTDSLAISQELIRRIQETGLQFSENINSLSAKLQDEWFAKKSELEAKASAYEDMLEKKHLAKMDEVDEYKKQLEQKQKEFDLREPRFVRRELRQKLLEEIEKRSEKFSLTKGTNRLRIPISITLYLLFFGFGTGAYLFGKELIIPNDISPTSANSSAQLIILSLKSLGLTLGAVATAFYYIKWQNNWFEKHAAAEFQLKQFQLDIDRASWLVETVQEWGDRQESIPPTLLESLSRNLFEHEHEHNEVEKHPVDELASALLGSAANAKIKIGNNELALDRRSIRDLKK